MNRRDFLKLSSVAALVAVIPSAPTAATHAPMMRHLFQNSDGELVAANTAEQASRYHDCELGGAAQADAADWEQVADGARIPIRDSDTGAVETRSAMEWAAEYDEPTVAATTYT